MQFIEIEYLISEKDKNLFEKEKLEVGCYFSSVKAMKLYANGYIAGIEKHFDIWMVRISYLNKSNKYTSTKIMT